MKGCVAFRSTTLGEVAMESDLINFLYLIGLSGFLLLSSSLFRRKKRKNKTKKYSSGRYRANLESVSQYLGAK